MRGWLWIVRQRLEPATGRQAPLASGEGLRRVFQLFRGADAVSIAPVMQICLKRFKNESKAFMKPDSSRRSRQNVSCVIGVPKKKSWHANNACIDSAIAPAFRLVGSREIDGSADGVPQLGNLWKVDRLPKARRAGSLSCPAYPAEDSGPDCDTVFVNYVNSTGCLASRGRLLSPNPPWWAAPFLAGALYFTISDLS